MLDPVSGQRGAAILPTSVRAFCCRFRVSALEPERQSTERRFSAEDRPPRPRVPRGSAYGSSPLGPLGRPAVLTGEGTGEGVELLDAGSAKRW